MVALACPSSSSNDFDEDEGGAGQGSADGIAITIESDPLLDNLPLHDWSRVLSRRESLDAYCNIIILVLLLNLLEVKINLGHGEFLMVKLKPFRHALRFYHN